MASENLAKLRGEVYDEILEFFSNDRLEAEQWCKRRVRGLGYISPEKAMQSEEGLLRLRTLLGRLQHGIPT